MRKIRFIRQPAVMDRVGFKDSTLYKEIQEGTFPPPIRISETLRRMARRSDRRMVQGQAQGKTLRIRSARIIAHLSAPQWRPRSRKA